MLAAALADAAAEDARAEAWAEVELAEEEEPPAGAGRALESFAPPIQLGTIPLSDEAMPLPLLPLLPELNC